jgi:hypothetical protein
MFQDLFHFDNAKVNATLDVLNHDSMKDNKIYDKLASCRRLLRPRSPDGECLGKAIDEFLACDQVDQFNEQ